MNFFHLQAKVISRGSGRSVIAAAAYASCSKLYNDYDGLTHDYTKKQGCVYSEIFLPKYAPPEWKNRQTLWDAVETIEKTKDRRLARELIVALPKELSLFAWMLMLGKFVREQGTELGMCADVNIHDTDGHNPHAHILLTMRPLDKQGNWQPKTQKEYLCKYGEKEQGFTAAEFKIAKLQGWEKQYSYQIGNKKEYLTPSEAKRIKDCVRLSKTPKSTRYGRQNPIVARWNSEEQLFAWRKSWETIVNEEQKLRNILERVDCRSHIARGKTEQPTIHEGYHARKLESMGILSDRCKLNRLIKFDNRTLLEQKQEVENLLQDMKEDIPSIVTTLENLCEHMVLLQYQLLLNREQYEELTSNKKLLTDTLAKYHRVDEMLNSKIARRNSLRNEKKKCGIHFVRANRLQEQITTLTEEIEELKNDKSHLLFRLNCDETEAISNVREMEASLEKLEIQYKTLFTQKEEYKKKFLETKHTISEGNQWAIESKLETKRFEQASKIIDKLMDIYQKQYDYDIFAEASEIIDKELQENITLKKKVSVRERLKISNQDTLPSKKTKNREHHL